MALCRRRRNSSARDTHEREGGRSRGIGEAAKGRRSGGAPNAIGALEDDAIEEAERLVESLRRVPPQRATGRTIAELTACWPTRRQSRLPARAIEVKTLLSNFLLQSPSSTPGFARFGAYEAAWLGKPGGGGSAG